MSKNFFKVKKITTFFVCFSLVLSYFSVSALTNQVEAIISGSWEDYVDDTWTHETPITTP